MMELFLTIFFISMGIALSMPILILLVGEIILFFTSGPPPRPGPRRNPGRNWRQDCWEKDRLVSRSWSRGG